MSAPTPPLAGLKVVDFSEQVPGPHTTRLLTALGCDVIKVERPGGDAIRLREAIFNAENRGKRSIALDLKTQEARGIALDLIAQADVLVEGFRPGVMERLGVGFDAALAVNPKIVYVSISGYGSFGPYRDLPGHDFQYLALAGAIPRPAEGTVADYVPTTLPIADLGSSLYASLGIVLALLQKQQDPAGFTGRHIDVAMADCALAMMEPRLAESIHLMTNDAALARPGYGIYATADGGYVSIGALEDHFWVRLTEALDLPDLRSEEFRTFAQRREAVTTIDAILRPRVARFGRDELVQLLIGHDVPVAPLNDLLEPAKDPHFLARGMVRDDGPGGTPRIAEWPLALAPFTDDRLLTTAPTVGEQSREILSQLGRTPEEVGHLFAEGIVHGA
ncbi:CaiB/BaiF CoA-transferase family protein [Arthrobacter sp. 18067]|uniref:CaiB/BaiF CoA transferase family protein n=1 Tax=Arthrobacter sp. 18067 TaxID=2681413 RepID=UPI00135CDB30|nr:CaiB/BaiF CoA-transferase family protein [Arthrobacter sp. 18067]